RRTRLRGFSLLHVRVEDDSGVLHCLWHNQPYLKNLLQEGRSVALFGEAMVPERGKERVLLQNPQVEILGEDPERIHTGRMVPVYRRTGDLSARRLRSLLHALLKRLPPDLEDPLSPEVRTRLGFLSRSAA